MIWDIYRDVTSLGMSRVGGERGEAGGVTSSGGGMAFGKEWEEISSSSSNSGRRRRRRRRRTPQPKTRESLAVATELWDAPEHRTEPQRTAAAACAAEQHTFCKLQTSPFVVSAPGSRRTVGCSTPTRRGE